MIETAEFRVITDNVRLFDETILPQGIYRGAMEWMEVFPAGHRKVSPARAIITIDRRFLEGLGAKIAPNLESVDFDLLKYVKSGDIEIVH